MKKEDVFKQDRILAPSILAADPLRLADDIKELPEEVGWLHVDIMDGHYVPNMNGSPELVKALREQSDKVIDVHLMVEKPERVIDLYLEAGADVLTIHQEACVHTHRWLSYIRQSGAKAGLTVNPGTSLSCIEELIDECDLLLLMSVNPGFGGQKFIPSLYSKIKRARRMLDQSGRRILLEVDGGVNAENAASLWEAGIDVMVAGSAVFGAPDRRHASRTLLGIDA